MPEERRRELNFEYRLEIMKVRLDYPLRLVKKDLVIERVGRTYLDFDWVCWVTKSTKPANYCDYVLRPPTQIGQVVDAMTSECPKLALLPPMNLQLLQLLSHSTAPLEGNTGVGRIRGSYAASSGRRDSKPLLGALVQ